MTLEEINTPEKEKEIANKLCEAYMLLVKVLKPYRSLICINNDNAENHPLETIKVLTPWANTYMTDALRAKMSELLKDIPQNIDSQFHTESLMRYWFGINMFLYEYRNEYSLEKYEKEYKNK